MQPRRANLHQAIHPALKQRLVVRHEQGGALVRSKPPAEPLLGARVEVIGGFVEEEEASVDADVGGVARGGEEKPGERDAHLPAAGERGAGSIPRLASESEAGEDVRDASLDGVPSESFPSFLRGEERDFGVWRARGDGRLGVGERALGVSDVRHAAAGLLGDGSGGSRDGGLLEVADVGAVCDEEVAGVDAADASHRAEEGALAASVGAHETHRLAGLHPEVRVHEQIAVADGDAHTLEEHHRARGVPAGDLGRLRGRARRDGEAAPSTTPR